MKRKPRKIKRDKSNVARYSDTIRELKSIPLKLTVEPTPVPPAIFTDVNKPVATFKEIFRK